MIPLGKRSAFYDLIVLLRSALTIGLFPPFFQSIQFFEVPSIIVLTYKTTASIFF